MTIACAVKVFDGIVLAADSATTMRLSGGSHQVWNNANKIVHLHRQVPIALMTWGQGQIGAASISTLAKDLRRRLMGDDPDHPDWALGTTWTIEGVADRVVEMFYDELYAPLYAAESSDREDLQLGLLLCGYGSDCMQPEAWVIEVQPGPDRPKPDLVMAKDDTGWRTFAQPEASERLFYGLDSGLFTRLQQELPDAEFAKVLAMIPDYQRVAIVAEMPFGDAIEVARFIAETTARYSHFLIGPDTVGGVIDIAAISRHEGFRWVQRKHYYSAELNPWGHAR